MPPETLDSLDKDSLKLLMLELLAQNKALKEQISVLLVRIAGLEARNGQPPKTPTNSSVPPSKGQKANRPEAPAQKKGRKGRPGVARALCPDPDVTREIYAESCSCGAVLSPADQPDVFAYDLIDLPPIKPVTTRINLHKGKCPCCGKRVAAQPPADMAPGTPFGPGVVSLVTYLHACQMVSYNRMTEVLDGLFGLKLSEGAIANMLARAAKPFAARADEIAETVRQSPVIASDETSARVCGKTHWQWTFAAATAVYHTIAPTRGKVVPAAFLGQAKPKVWLSDRLAAQCKHADAHQYCLAHLIRDAQYLARELDRLLALKATQTDGRHLQASMFVDARDKLLVFLTRRDVEPTNSVSERALRPSVIFRKVTNGFRSGWGAKAYADLCSIVATGRLNGRSPLTAIRTALAAPA